jgi:hypothetical protein
MLEGAHPVMQSDMGWQHQHDGGFFVKVNDLHNVASCAHAEKFSSLRLISILPQHLRRSAAMRPPNHGVSVGLFLGEQCLTVA